MRIFAKTIEETLVTFHIGRGGRFYNQGFLTYVDQDNTIQSYVESLFVGFENEGEIIDKVRDEFEEAGKELNQSDLIDCFTDRNVDKLKEVYNVEESELGVFGYKDSNGNWLDLPIDSITGVIDIDGDYDTTYVKHLSDCTESEFRAIVSTTNYVSQDVVSYAKKQLGIEESEEENG